MRLAAGIVTFMVIIALGVGFVPIIEISYVETVEYQKLETYLVDEPYEATETYYIDEPYEATETYYIDEPYEDTEIYITTEQVEVVKTFYEPEPLAYEVIESHTDIKFSHTERRVTNIGGVTIFDKVVEVFNPVGYVSIQNMDNIKGTIDISISFYSLEEFRVGLMAQTFNQAEKDVIKNWGTKHQNKFSVDVEQGEIKIVEYIAKNIDLSREVWHWEYTISKATKDVEKQRIDTIDREVEKERLVTKIRQVEKERLITKIRQIEKERLVTKYREVAKERTVIKERPETRYKKVPVFEYLLSRFKL